VCGGAGLFDEESSAQGGSDCCGGVAVAPELITLGRPSDR
jgi:hypothetical protein